MLHFLRKIIKPKYEPLNHVEINAANIIDNYNYLQSCQPGAAIFPVLKSNAYGHGLKEMCQIINKTTAQLVIVDSFPEAQIVYRHYHGAVLILGEMPLQAYDYCRFNRTEFVVYNSETLRYLARFGKRSKIHLFYNSGMNREGIKDLPAFISKNKEYLEKVTVNGFASHLASAETDSALNKKQADNFFIALNILQTAGFKPRWVHLGNSALILKNNQQLPLESSSINLLTAYRSGLALFGYNPFKSQIEAIPSLKPALEIFSKVVAVQELGLGESVSYNETYQTTQPTRLAIIPFGYCEGLDRRLSNRAKFLIKNSANVFWAPIAGRVSMNLTCLDAGQNTVALGDQVKVVSSQANDFNSLSNLADLLETIPYEFLVKIQANIRRVIV